MARPAGNALVRRLATHGGWMGRAALVAGLEWAEFVLDEELADLVAEGTVVFNTRMREYRLGGTPWARRAMQQLLDSGVRKRAVVGHTRNPPGTHIGMAQRVAGPDGTDRLVMAEIEMPLVSGLDQMAQLVTHMDAWAR